MAPLIQGLGYVILVAIAAMGWAGYYTTFREKIKDRERLPENIRKIYYGEV